ncbi:hypothetical protein C8R48DRAFT_669125 [Suillus tomentosus]|nr:hypothetical protein C8R48DRAFT_669125 [Suillus tomentosus]
MSSGPVRNAPRRRHAQTPFYHAAARPGPTTSRFRVAPALPHDVIEITTNKEIPSRVSVIDITTTDNENTSQTPVCPHRKPAPAVRAEASVEILFDDEAAEQAGDVALMRMQQKPSWQVSALRFRRSYRKGICLWSAPFAKQYSENYTLSNVDIASVRHA